MFFFTKFPFMNNYYNYWFFILLIINAYIVTVLAITHESINLRCGQLKFKEIIGKGYRRNLFRRL